MLFRCARAWSTRTPQVSFKLPALTLAFRLDRQIARASAGEKHTLFLTTLGEVWACGAAEYGRCGNGTWSDHFVPVLVEALDHHVVVDVQVREAYMRALGQEVIGAYGPTVAMLHQPRGGTMYGTLYGRCANQVGYWGFAHWYCQ